MLGFELSTAASASGKNKFGVGEVSLVDWAVPIWALLNMPISTRKIEAKRNVFLGTVLPSYLAEPFQTPLTFRTPLK
jgi:hypothetical protein